MSDNVTDACPKITPVSGCANVGASTGSGNGGGGGGGGLTAHALNGPFHTGVIDPDQAPWALSGDELDNHIADPDAHHAQIHVLATGTALGVHHTINGTARRAGAARVLRYDRRL